MSWSLRVGAIQMRSTGDLVANLATCRTLAQSAVAEGAQVVILPECFAFLGRGEGDKLAVAEAFEVGQRTDGGPVLSMLREIATTHRVWVIGGGTPEIVPGDPKRTYNTAL